MSVKTDPLDLHLVLDPELHSQNSEFVTTEIKILSVYFQMVFGMQ